MKLIKIEQTIGPLKEVELTPVSLEIKKKDIPIERWLKIGESLEKIEGAVQWWVGDWLNAGEQKYGEMYSQALEKTDYDYETLKQYKRVADKVEKCSRLHNLSWSHHQEVAHLLPQEQTKLLKRALDEGWTRTELRQKLRKVENCQHDFEEKKYQQCKKCGKKEFS